MQEIETYADRIRFPVTKEELINGALAENLPGDRIALIERLPRPEYQNREQLNADLEEIAKVTAAEVDPADTYADYLELVIRNVGDVSHATKDTFNRVVEAVLEEARREGRLSDQEAASMRLHLDAAFANLRGSMSEVTDDTASIDPEDDLPTYTS
ncbi:MAG TPA: DUF2795 domain-containing protein [Chloroflexota bacterium]|nr:DUF2795 domain-containing protein [Chloroflexota bacterium]